MRTVILRQRTLRRAIHGHLRTNADELGHSLTVAPHADRTPLYEERARLAAMEALMGAWS